MKVLHVINNLGSGGAEKLVEESVPLINRKGIKVDVLLLTDCNNVFEGKLKESGVKVITLHLRKPYNPVNIFYIKKCIIKGEYDIVHAHLFPTIYWVSIASKLMFNDRPKFVMTEHSTFNRRRERSYLKHLEKFIYSSYDSIISISQQAQDNLKLWLKPKQNKLGKFIVIKNGVDIDKFKTAIPYKKSEICSQFTEDTRLISMIGRFSEAKDQPTLIKAMQRLPSNTHLLLVGEGPFIQQNKNLAKEIGVSSRVHFLGFRNDVDRILKTSDIIVLSSHWEGLSLASIESMASGKPFIASKVPGLEEVVGGYGLLFEEENSEELSKLINELLNNKKLYKQISDRCSDRASDFSINTMTDLLVSTYKMLLTM